MTPQTMIIVFFGIIVLVPLSMMLYSLFDSLKSSRDVDAFTVRSGEREGMSLRAVERVKKR